MGGHEQAVEAQLAFLQRHTDEEGIEALFMTTFRTTAEEETT
jgi:hypothetical protein